MIPRQGSCSRRRFLTVSIAALGALPVGAGIRGAAATQLAHLDEDLPAARALGYVHDASTIGAELRGAEDRVCSNCRFFIKDDGGWGPCNLFPGNAVAAKGWCKGWAAAP